MKHKQHYNNCFGCPYHKFDGEHQCKKDNHINDRCKYLIDDCPFYETLDSENFIHIEFETKDCEMCPYHDEDWLIHYCNYYNIQSRNIERLKAVCKVIE